MHPHFLLFPPLYIGVVTFSYTISTSGLLKTTVSIKQIQHFAFFVDSKQFETPLVICILPCYSRDAHKYWISCVGLLENFP